VSRPKLTLAMIVRNGCTGLARCLKSALPAVDAVVIGDTGSTDSSVEIARELGARVFGVAWENDFSKARNAVLAEVETDWVLWMDDDEMLDPAGAKWIPALLEANEKAKSPIDAYEVWRWNYVNSLNSRSGGLKAEPNPFRLEESRPFPAYTRYLNTLLFRRLPGVYFESPVHETVARRVRALGLHAAEAPFVIHHFGFAPGTEERRKEKNEYYHQLGLENVRLHPEDSWAHYQLGLSALEHHHDPAEALGWLDRSLALKPSNQAAWVYSGICLTRLGRLQEALDRLHRAAGLGAVTELLAEAAGDVYFKQNDPALAAQWYEKVGQASPSGPEAVSALVDCKRGACQVRMGDTATGLARIEAAVAREPQAGELYEIWAAAALQAGDTATAARVAAERLSIGRPPAGSFVVAAVLAARLGQWEGALDLLTKGRNLYPEDRVLQREAQTAREKIATTCGGADPSGGLAPAVRQTPSASLRQEEGAGARGCGEPAKSAPVSPIDREGAE